MKKHSTGIIFEKNDKLDKYHYIFKVMFKDLKERKFKVRFHKKQVLSLKRIVSKLDTVIFRNLDFLSIFSQCEINKVYNQFIKNFLFILEYHYSNYRISLNLRFDLNKSNKINQLVVSVCSSNPYGVESIVQTKDFNVNEINNFVRKNVGDSTIPADFNSM